MATTNQQKRLAASKRKMQEAARTMDEQAKKLGNWDPQSIVRQFRDGDLSEKSKRGNSEQRGSNPKNQK